MRALSTPPPVPPRPRFNLLWLLIILGVYALFSASGCRMLDRLMGNTGAPCSTDDNCATGLVCLTEFPGGYCSMQTCSQGGCPGMYATCAMLDASRNVTACVEGCNSNIDCRQGEGYVCADLDGSRGCMPAQQSTGSAGEIGSSCTRDSDCSGDLTCLTNFVFGYCSRACSSHNDCGSDGRCINQGGDVMRCMRACQNNSQCRFSYACQQVDGQNVCDADDSSTAVRNPNGTPDGQGCTVDVACVGGTCITGTDFPGGYCTTRSCDVVGCSDANSVCVGLEREALCFVRCEDSAQCREGYRCTSLDTGEKVCYALSPIRAPEIEGGAIEIRCDATSSGRVRTATFELPAGSVGFAIVPFSPANSEVTPLRLRAPDGSVLNFAQDYSFQTINSLLLGTIVPMSFPGAPAFERFIQAGTYRFEYETDDASSCYFVVPQASVGRQLDLNFYFVGVPGLNAGNAASHTQFQATMQEVRTIFNNASITIGTVRTFDISGDNATRYSMIRDFSDIYRLLALSSAPGPSRDEALSLNVFLINDFNIAGLPGLLGLSAGIPGVPGVHGNGGAGLVFSSVNLRDAPTALGQTLAHEAGHFLGLRHTSERGGTEFDPLDDTPRCNNPENPYSCPDVNNLMFPFSVDVEQRQITTNQRFVIQRNPLVKP